MCVVRSLILAISVALSLVLVSAPSARADESGVEVAGDYLQVILPVTGAVCSFGRSVFTDYAVRFFAHWGLVHGTKFALADTEIGIRPHGGNKGFPSGHTAAAFYGASYLARDCLGKSPWGQAAVFGAAMFTGGSRIEAGAHFLIQVMFGALIGFGADRLFRKKGAARGPERWHAWRDRWNSRTSRRSS